LGAWYRGQSLVWDATVVDTFPGCHYEGTAATKADVVNRFVDGMIRVI